MWHIASILRTGVRHGRMLHAAKLVADFRERRAGQFSCEVHGHQYPGLETRYNTLHLGTGIILSTIDSGWATACVHAQ